MKFIHEEKPAERANSVEVAKMANLTDELGPVTRAFKRIVGWFDAHSVAAKSSPGKPLASALINRDYDALGRGWVGPGMGSGKS
jgi:hypothetical protein